MPAEQRPLPAGGACRAPVTAAHAPLAPLADPDLGLALLAPVSRERSASKSLKKTRPSASEIQILLHFVRIRQNHLENK